jgi:hypothetical protein
MRPFKIISIISVLIGLASAAFAEPPASSGIVTRGSYETGWVDIDTHSGLLSIVGVDIVQWCTDGAPFDTFYYKDKDLQDGFRLNTVEQAYVQASVWPITVFDCELFTTVQPLATGMAYFRSHDNDLFGPRFCEEKNNANAFGRRANGTLYSPSGEARQFSMHTTGLFDCETFTFPLYKTKIKLTK